MPREHPRYASMQEKWEQEADERGYMEYPMMVYPGAADQSKPYGKNGKPLKGLLVQNEDERDRALGLGAYAAVEEAPETVDAGGGAQRLKTPDDEKAELMAKAETMGVKFDKRWSPERIEAAIADFEAAQGSKDIL